MRILLALLLLAPAPAAPGIGIKDGMVEFRAADGTVRQLTGRGKWGSPTLSPDGRTAAFTLHEVEAEGGDMDSARSSLWIADVATGKARKLVTPRFDAEPKKNLAALYNPVFSNDGRFVYVEAAAWVTSPAIHQVNVATGRTRFVVDGALWGILRNGPWRGNLVVEQHRYHPAPEFGSYQAVSVIRPSGKRIAYLPGSEKGEAEADIEGWLKQKGWRL
jgi:dipeptidyl aminopeptidase/acylaminoacyl peptidase